MKRSARQAGITVTQEEEEKPIRQRKCPEDLQEEPKDMQCTTYEGLFEAKFGPFKKTTKIAGFDMDWTIIATKSGNTFATGPKDWKFLYADETQAKLRQLHEDDYQVVVFTNQGGVSSGNTSVSELTQKFTAIQKELEIPMLFLAAISSHDKHRKPAVGMLDYYESTFGKVDKSKSFYCGDAAGRPATNTAKKDFSADDLKFAWNSGLRFETPESFFLGQPQVGVQQRLFQPKTEASTPALSLIKEGKEGTQNILANKGQELVVFVGSPGAGKSSIWQLYFSGYARVNNDTLKTPAKCMKVCQEALIKGESVCIDNTNPTADVRARYLDIAKKLKITARCIYFDIDKPTCFHNNFMRKANSHRKHLSGAVAGIPIHSFFKNHTVPQLNEGFEDIVKIQFVQKFENKDDENAYNTLVL